MCTARKMKFAAFVFILLVSAAIAKNEIYMGERVYKIHLNDAKQEDQLVNLKNDLIDFWRYPSFKYGIDGLAMMPESQSVWFELELSKLGIEKSIVIDDVYNFLKDKEPSVLNTKTDNRRSIGGRMFSYDSFHSYQDITDQLDIFAEIHESVEVVQHGTTGVGGRPLVYVKISTTNFTGSIPVVVIEAAINPREWITVPAAVYVINQLHVAANANLLQSIDWIIIPVVNPDGYEFTRTTSRFWEKNLSTKPNLGEICPGANINRNFDYAWLGIGSSSSPCSNLYAGVEAFSEEETQLIKAVTEEYQARLRLYVSLNNAGSFVSYPWARERAATRLFRKHHLLAEHIVQGMDGYEVDIASIGLGDRASGCSTDYMHHKQVPFSINIGIPQDVNNGVVIPEENIRSLIDLVWTGISRAANYVIQP